MTTDSTLIKKVSSIMMDLVPMNRAGDSPNSIVGHVDAIRSVIYKYFHRFDPSSKGRVGEEQFVKFAQKSGLKTRLRAAELRKLLSKLRVRSNETMTSMIDYEKLYACLVPLLIRFLVLVLTLLCTTCRRLPESRRCPTDPSLRYAHWPIPVCLGKSHLKNSVSCAK